MENAINTDAIEEYINTNNLTKSEFCRKCNISVKAYGKLLQRKRISILLHYLKLHER